MNTFDDLRAAFTRLEQLTPLESDSLAEIGSTPTPLGLVTPMPAQSLRRPVAILGAAVGVAATIATVAVVTGSFSSGSSPKPVPVGNSSSTSTAQPTPSGSLNPTTSATSTTAIVGQPGVTTTPSGAGPSVTSCPTGVYYPSTCGTSSGATPTGAGAPLAPVNTPTGGLAFTSAVTRP